MKLSLRKQSISLKSLVLTLLLSFIGQAWALPDICAMSSSKVSSSEVSSSGMLAADRVIEKKSASPCHMMTEGSAASLAAQMDCCESPTKADSSCTCPDEGCSGSIIFSSQDFASAYSYSGLGNYYSQSGFPNQINSALFRPPIA